ncbi:hypothetical protein ScPMuIL_008936 [Solemya velum]
MEGSLSPINGTSKFLYTSMTNSRQSTGQLREFIPQLILMVSGEKNGHFSKKTSISKPQWWPADIKWDMQKTGIKRILQHSKVTVLSKIIRNCYRYHGQEKLLDPVRPLGLSSPPRVPLAQCTPAHSCFCAQENIKMYKDTKGLHVSPRQTFSEVYICFFCESEFHKKDDMRLHQANCERRPPELQAIGTPPRPKKQQDVSSLGLKKDLFDKLRPCKDVYIRTVGLVPTVKAQQIRERTRKTTEVDCAFIDLEEPMSPTTPKTPTSLMSQLSRDLEASSRKRLTYSDVGETDKESVHSNCSDDNDEAGKQKKQSLLNIAISSLLGQRIQKHVDVETGYQVCKDREAFCKTPEKNEFLDRLRNRTIAYNVTFRPRKQMMATHYHKYKFNSKQRTDFSEHMATGLNRGSRNLWAAIPKCSVVLKKLSDEDISEWIPLCALVRKKNVRSENEDATFPEGPALLDHNIDKMLGLKRRSEDQSLSSGSSPLTLANVVSEHVNAEVSKQKLTLYRSLLSEFSMKPVFVNVQQINVAKECAVLKSPGKKQKVKKDKKRTKGKASYKKISGKVNTNAKPLISWDNRSHNQQVVKSFKGIAKFSVCGSINQTMSTDVERRPCDRSSPVSSETSPVEVRTDKLSTEENCQNQHDGKKCNYPTSVHEDNEKSILEFEETSPMHDKTPIKNSSIKTGSQMFFDKLHIDADLETLHRSLPSPASSTKSDPVCDGVPHLTLDGTLSEPATPGKYKLQSVRRTIDMDMFASGPSLSDETINIRRSKRVRMFSIQSIPPAKIRKLMTEP